MSTATLDISEARRKLTTLDRELGTKKVIWVTRHSKRAFAMVNREWMEALLETIEILQDGNAARLLKKSLDDLKKGRLMDQEDLDKEMKSWPSR